MTEDGDQITDETNYVTILAEPLETKSINN